MANHIGTCHCGAVRARITTTLSGSLAPLRACQCGFCRRHGAKTFADPSGSATIESDQRLTRYRFGKSTADFLLCARCGVYIAAAFNDTGRTLATVNVAGLRMLPFAEQTAGPVSYDDEDADGRRSRRRSKWMPVEVIERNLAVETGEGSASR